MKDMAYRGEGGISQKPPPSAAVISKKPQKIHRFASRCVLWDMPNVSRNGMSAASIALAEQTKAVNLVIAQGLKRQDADLLDELIVRYQHRLLRYLLYLTGSREVAEDLFQETWMRVLLRGAQYNGNARFDTWLFTIARNLLIDMRRKRTMASLDEMCEIGEDERPFEVASDEPNPFDRYQSQEDARRVAEALLTLDPLHREVLVLRFHEDMALDEIAGVTRAPLSTVKSRLYRGLAALKPRVIAATGRASADAGSKSAYFRQPRRAAL
jgi:RNA polymerase sigma-70 factor, ECF subfamily